MGNVLEDEKGAEAGTVRTLYAVSDVIDLTPSSAPPDRPRRLEFI